MEIKFNSIGYIKSPYQEVKEIPKQGAHTESEGELIIYDEFIEGLEDVDKLTHIVIFFNFHKSENYDLLQHIRNDKSTKKVGVFATRSPHRPNGIGMSIVEVLKVQGNSIVFKGVDMLNNTPVIDIKPYAEHLNPRKE